MKHHDTKSTNSVPLRPGRYSSCACPDLPVNARLTCEQEAEAAKAGKWLDDYVNFAAQASPLTPRAFHMASALFAGSLAIARRLHLEVSVETNTIYPNIYMLFVGHSTRPRKTTGERVLRGLLQRADMNHFLLADRQTPEALALDLTTTVPPTYDTWPEDQQSKWLRERAISAQRGWLLAEASHLLDSFNRDYTNGLLPIVLDLYDCSDQGPQVNTVNRGRQSVERPYLSIFGATTYGAMAEHLRKQEHWHNGLWARFAIIGTDESGIWKFWPEPIAYPDTLVESLRFIAHSLLSVPNANLVVTDVYDNQGGIQKRKTVVVSPDLTSHNVQVESLAWQHWENYSRAVSYEMLPEEASAVPEKFYASYGRLGTMLIKVAIILATFDTRTLPVIVRPCHVYRAQKIVETWRANLHNIFDRVGELTGSSLADDIKSALAKNGDGWTSRRELLRGMGKLWPALEPTVTALVESGEIERRQTEGQPGPKSEEYRLDLTD